MQKRSLHRGILFSHCIQTTHPGAHESKGKLRFFAKNTTRKNVGVEIFGKKMKSLAMRTMRCIFAMRKEKTVEQQ